MAPIIPITLGIILTAVCLYIGYALFFKPFRFQKFKTIELPEVSTIDFKNVKYEPNRVSFLPEIHGRMVAIITRVMSSLFGQLFLIPAIFDVFDLRGFRTLIFSDRQTHDPVGPVLESTKPDASATTTKNVNEYYEKCLRSCENSRINFFLNQFESKKLSVTDYCEQIIKNAKNDPTNSIVQMDENWIRKQAQESQKRYDQKTNRQLEGITFTVKEMCDVVGFYKNCGVANSAKDPATEMSETVQKLLDMGAILVGMVNLHQLGVGITGLNSSPGYKGGAKNPYSLNHYSGGSSSGSATSVATNLVCFSIGNDGGGSIRLPASHCGLVGLKATWGRISMHGENSDLSSTVTHSGPLCRSVTDAIYIYGVIGGKSEVDKCGVVQPEVELPLTSSVNDNKDNKNRPIEIGIWDEWNTKSCSGQQKTIFLEALKRLEKCSWFSPNRSFRLPEMFYSRTAHSLTIVSEMSTGAGHLLHNQRQDLSNDVKTYLTAGERGIYASDYIKAGKQKTRAMKFLERVFKETDIDVFITPTLGCDIRERHPGDSQYTNIRTNYLLNMINFVFIGNLTGIPAVTVPVGSFLDENTGKRLPVGLQVSGPWWKESLILDVAKRIEDEFGLVERPGDVYFEYTNTE